MLLSPSWKPSSPVSSPYALEPLHSPPLTADYSDTADTRQPHCDVSVSVELCSHTCDKDNGGEEKSTAAATPLSVLYDSLSSDHDVSCEPPPAPSDPSTFLSATAAHSSHSLSPLPHYSPAVTPPPSITLREGATPTTNGSNSSYIASLNGSPPRLYDNGTAFHTSSDVPVPHTPSLLSRPSGTSPFTLPKVEGERSRSPPRNVDQRPPPSPPLQHDFHLSLSSPLPLFPSSHSLSHNSSLNRLRPMYGAYNNSHPPHRRSLLAPWTPSRHMPLHILADTFSSLAYYPPTQSTFDEQYGNTYQPYPHSLHYHHSDVQSDSNHAKQSWAEVHQQHNRVRRAGRDDAETAAEEETATSGDINSLGGAESNGELYNYDARPLHWPPASTDITGGQQQNGHSSGVEHYTSGRRRCRPSHTALSAPLPQASTELDSPTPKSRTAVLLPINGGSGDGSTESDLSVPVRLRVKAKRGRVVKREQQSPVQSVVLSTRDAPSPARNRRSAINNTLRAASVIRALQVDTSASIDSQTNGWNLPGRSNYADTRVKPAAQRRKRARSQSATSVSSQPPQLPTTHSPPASTHSSSPTLAAAFPMQHATNHLPPPLPSLPVATHTTRLQLTIH